MKSSKVSIKTRSTPASLSFKGQATKHTTVKWSFVTQTFPILKLIRHSDGGLALKKSASLSLHHGNLASINIIIGLIPNFNNLLHR